MYRLLIADDEPLEREGLEWIIGKSMPGRFTVTHAENGRGAIELAAEERPHIIFMDVNMPGIQGLEALREIRSFLPEAKLVMVTAYDYFSYAKEALSLGVKEYIVKPASQEEIVLLLQRLTEELDREKQKRAAELLLQDRVSQLLPLAESELAMSLMLRSRPEGPGSPSPDWLEFPLDRGLAVVAALPAVPEAAERRLYDAFRRMASGFGQGITSSPVDHHLAMFLRLPPEGQEADWVTGVRRFGEQLREYALTRLELPVSLGIGTLQEDAAGWHRSYYEAVFASSFAQPGGPAVLFADLKSEERLLYEREPQGEAFRREDRSYVLAAMARIRQEREEETATLMDRAKAFIRAHYTEELSLEKAADHVHLNAYYFSKIFKQQTGETFIDYLTSLRIGRAKELIVQGGYSQKEICYLVGYNDPNYFSRVFKKVTGLTPTEYRDSRNGEVEEE
jgi:two-component system, response regulator YesN